MLTEPSVPSRSATGGSRIPPIISVDDHVVEPPDLWLRWLPSNLRDSGPKVVRKPFEVRPRRAPGGSFHVAASGPETDFWVYDDKYQAIGAGFAAAGRDADHIDELPVPYADMRPGFY